MTVSWLAISAVDVYNSLMADGATDRKGLYKKLLKPDAAKRNAQADELAGRIDETISTANSAIGSLRPE